MQCKFDVGFVCIVIIPILQNGVNMKYVNWVLGYNYLRKCI